MDQSFDARRIKATGGIDARGINPPPAPPGCPECGTALRASGPGRRPVYCSRACSSKAYRKRRTEDHQDAVADALISSRVEIPAEGDRGDRELLDLAAAVQRAAVRYLQQLDQARHGEGDDPRFNQALQRLEAAVTGATQRLLRHEVTSARLQAERATVAAEAAAAVPAPAGPAAAPAGTAPTAPVAVDLVPTRVESTGPGADLVPTRVETDRPGADVIPPLVPTPGGCPRPRRPRSRPRVQRFPARRNPRPRARTAQQQLTADGPSRGTVAQPSGAAPTGPLRRAAPAPAVPAGQPAPAVPGFGRQGAAVVAEVPEQLRLALARGLGAPTDTWSVPDSDLVLEGWVADPGLFAVRRPDRRLVGWVATADDGGGWGTFADGRQVVDAADGEPWLSQDPQHAVSLLQAALGPQIT